MAKVKEFKTKALNADDNIFTALGFDLTSSGDRSSGDREFGNSSDFNSTKVWELQSDPSFNRHVIPAAVA